MQKNDLTQEQLKELLKYDSKTGIFTWKDRPNPRIHIYDGHIAGTTMKDGYRMIRIFRMGYLAHRLAYLYMTGRFPPDQIDHINGVRDDNRWGNLRPVTRRENFQNKKCHRNGNMPGASYCPKENKARPWRAQIQINKKKIFLGHYETELSAHKAYANACIGIV